MTYLSPMDYGLIGNTSSVALVSRTGSVDWLCLPNLDSPAHFTAYFDEGLGSGRFQIVPQGESRSKQTYRERSLILDTTFETHEGRAILTDWMPLASGSMKPDEHLLCRRLEVLEGHISWTLHCAPRFGYGTYPGVAEPRGASVLFRGSPLPGSGELATLTAPKTAFEIAPTGHSATSKFTLEAGEVREFLWAWGRRPAQTTMPEPASTLARWHELAHRCTGASCSFAGPWHDQICRSALVIKTLTAPYSGAIAEAAATSGPGVSRGTRTWDYRYASVRDSAICIQALSSMGLKQEAREHFEWIAGLVTRDKASGLQALYTLDGGHFLVERESNPFTPNPYGAPNSEFNMRAQVTGRFQLDLFGHVMVAAREYYSVFEELPDGLWDALSDIAETVCHAWRRPDHGPGEMRMRPEHYVVSKLYCWAALDRAIELAELLGESVPSRWKRERDIIHHTICEQGFDSNQHSFINAYGERGLDAGLLMIPLLGFLPFDDLRVQGTIAAIQLQLSSGVLLYQHSPSDFPVRQEGAHLHSSLLLVSCLALSGRIDEASDHLAEICSFATPLGLFGEQVNPSNGDPSGGFPCAQAHLSLIYAGNCLAFARGRLQPTGIMPFGLTRENTIQSEPLRRTRGG